MDIFFPSVSSERTSLVQAAEPGNSNLLRMGTIHHEPIREASGLVQSRQFPGVLWTIADSGNDAHLFAVKRSGELIAEYNVSGAINVDWESLAIDDAGHLFICDVGNNVFPGGLPRRWVYQVKEPNPWRSTADDVTKLQTVSIQKTFTYTFPETRIDVEGTFWRDGKLYLISKVREGPTRLYQLSLDSPEKRTQLIEVCELPRMTSVTGAAISPDGKCLAVCNYKQVTLFCLRETGVKKNGFDIQPLKTIPFSAPAVEGCCWDGRSILLVSERRGLYRLVY